MKGLSKKETEIVAWLEFHQRYFFSVDDIDRFARDRTQRYNIVKNLVKKGRIVKLNRRKYYLIPIKAKSGIWVEHPFILADEICDGRNYAIGGWAAAQYWRLTTQVPMQTEVYTTRRQGKVTVLNSRMIFRRTTERNVRRAIPQSMEGHTFRIFPKERVKRWLSSRA